MASKFEITHDKSDWHFNLLDNEGHCLLTSQHYASKSACERGIKSVKANSRNAENYEMRTAKDGRFYFAINAANQETVGHSPMYASPGEREYVIEAVKREAQKAEIHDLA